jgi:hypothetical protein
MAASGRPEQNTENRQAGYRPSRGFLLGMTGAAAFALLLALTTVIAASQNRDSYVQPRPQGPAPTVQVSHAPRETTPPDDVASNEPTQSQAPAPVVRGEVATPAPTLTPQPTIASSVSASPTPTASSWEQPPAFEPPSPGPAPAAAALALAADAKARYGVEIVLEGQDWGDDEAEQVQNVGAVISAMQMLPQTLISSIVQTPHGALTFVSNREGRTLDGWRPYGTSSRNFYTNSDHGPGGYHPSHQIVLATGAPPMTIAHELIHAWQFRNAAPDAYVETLLGDEMRSFMAAVGWRQVATDEEVRAAVNEHWETVNRLFVYEGRELPYIDEWGNNLVMRASNPLEAMATVGAIYYARPAHMPLPDWPEYWTWFDATFGSEPDR